MERKGSIFDRYDRKEVRQSLDFGKRWSKMDRRTQALILRFFGYIAIGVGILSLVAFLKNII